MSSSQNLEPSSSSSIRAPYAPFFNKSSTSSFDSCCTCKEDIGLVSPLQVQIQHWTILVNWWTGYPVETSFAVDVLEDGFIQAQLQTGLVKHLPLVGVAGDESVDLHSLPLANPMTASLGLQGNTEGERLSRRGL